ncbi:MAG: phosphatidylserine/phosphatidylglycerophosphate/cardiolipin synthase family protein [Bdellovibrio sp.]|nr:phosphatidylserine/phosphatidylglycerophosphate/cardiolipin synthase family protein [Bdellovibrio sp.]
MSHAMKILVFLLIYASFATYAASELQVFKATSNAPHAITIYDHGLASLYARLKMIERAKESIDIEYFIYDTSPSSRVFNQALVKKAKEGVKVRVLLDYFLIIPEIDAYHALQLEQAGIEVKYYNIESMAKFLKFQYRSHRKLLAIDGKEAITGGRNIADEYFDLSDKFNFIDKDIYINGPLVRDMSVSFEIFWNDKLSQKLDLEKYRHLIAEDTKWIQNKLEENGKDDSYFKQVASQDKVLDRHYKILKGSLKKEQEKLDKARKFLVESDEDRKLLGEIEELGSKQAALSPTGQCSNLIFTADYPGWGREYRKTKGMRGIVNQYMGAVKEELTIDSPYFIPDKESRAVLKDVLKAKKKVSVLTNSLYSTDAIYVNAVFNSIIPSWIKKGLRPYAFVGKIPDSYPVVNAGVEKARFGTHVKAFVFDHDSFMVGTYNLDPRSTKYNAEMGIFCFGEPELAQAMRAEYDHKLKGTIYLDSRKTLRKHKFDNITFAKKVVYYLIKPFAMLFQAAL